MTHTASIPPACPSRTCRTCESTKPLSSFGPDKRTADGISKRCSDCVAEAKQAEREKARAYNAKWRSKNRDYDAQWRATNRGYAAFQTALHKQETPACLTAEQKEEILARYKKAALWSDATDTAYHVDHIIPRAGFDEEGNLVVCGLHVPHNLQILPAELNGRKGRALLEELV